MRAPGRPLGHHEYHSSRAGHLCRWAIIFLATASPKCGSSPTAPASEGEPGIAWSRLSGRIAYVVSGLGRNRIYVLDASSRQRRVLFEKTGTLFSLAWSPDGRWLAYSTFNTVRFAYELHGVDAAGGDMGALFVVGGHDNFPAWSSDNRLAYWSDLGGSRAGIRINGWTFIDNVFCRQTRPAWSPDDQFLVVSLVISSTEHGLYRVNLDDRRTFLIHRGEGTRNDELLLNPAVSPDGTSLAFSKELPVIGGRGRTELWTVRLDGTGARRLTSGPRIDDDFPTWSPDGSQILFTRGLGEQARLFIIGANGENLEPVMNDRSPHPADGQGQYPTWTR